MRKNGLMSKSPANHKRSQRSWGWLIMLIVIVLAAGGGMGFVLVSNALASNNYKSRISSGDLVATLTIPRFGDSYAVPIVEGTSLEDLRQGVGWYSTTSAPGQVGNFAIAGHRLGWGQPFADLETLQVGDEIRVTKGETTYTYHVITGPTVILADQSNVLAGVPGEPERAPTKALITLTTAASLLPSPDRLVVIGELDA
jgi:sortase A